jgi:hypothetical protein
MPHDERTQVPTGVTPKVAPKSPEDQKRSVFFDPRSAPEIEAFVEEAKEKKEAPNRFQEFLGKFRDAFGGAQRAVLPNVKELNKDLPYAERVLALNPLSLALPALRRSLPALRRDPELLTLGDTAMAVLRDFNLAFAITKEAAAAGLSDVGLLQPSRNAEALRWLISGDLKNIRGGLLPEELKTVEFAEQVRTDWADAEAEGGDSYDTVASFNRRIYENRLERDPYFFAEKLISEFAEPTILAGWNGALVSWAPLVGGRLASADKVFTRVMSGILEVPLTGTGAAVRKAKEIKITRLDVFAAGKVAEPGALISAAAQKLVNVRWGSRAWFALPFATQRQAINRRANQMADSFRVLMGGEFVDTPIGAVAEKLGRLMRVAREETANLQALTEAFQSSTPAAWVVDKPAGTIDAVGDKIAALMHAATYGGAGALDDGARELALNIDRIQQSMSGTLWTSFWDNLQQMNPIDAAEAVRLATTLTYTKLAAERIAANRAAMSIWGEIISWPGNTAFFVSDRMLGPLIKGVMRPLTRMFLATPLYTAQNVTEDILRIFLQGHGAPGVLTELEYHSFISGLPHAGPSGLAARGKGLTPQAGTFGDAPALKDPKSFKNPMAYVEGGHKLWQKWFLDSSATLTIPLQRAYDVMRLVAHSIEDWGRYGLTKTTGGRALEDAIQGGLHHTQAENLQAIRDQIRLAVIASSRGDFTALDAVAGRYLKERITERLYNEVMQGVAMTPWVQHSLREWVRRGALPGPELQKALAQTRERYMEELMQKPETIKALIETAQEVIRTNLDDITELSQARSLFNSLQMMHQELNSIVPAVNQAAGHLANIGGRGTKSRKVIWDEAEQVLKDYRGTVSALRAETDNTLEALVAKFPRSASTENMMSLMRARTKIDRVYTDAADEVGRAFNELEKIHGKRTGAFWEALYDVKISAWDKAHDFNLKTMAAVMKKAGVVGDVNLLATKATAESAWGDFNSMLVRITAEFEKAAESRVTASSGKIAAWVENVKATLSAADDDTLTRLHLLREGGKQLDPRTGRIVERQSIGQKASTDTLRTFTNYEDVNSLDALMTHVFPFWQYGSRASVFLATEALRKPKFFQMFSPIEGQYWEYTENGYIETPISEVLPFLKGTPLEGLQVSPVKGLIFGRMTGMNTRPSYDSRFTGIAGKVDKAFDKLGKVGLWPFAPIGSLPEIAASFAQGHPKIPIEIVPPVGALMLNTLIAAAPGTFDHLLGGIFGRDFQDRITAGFLAREGITPLFNRRTATFENPASELTPALRAAAMTRAIIDLFNVFRFRPVEQRKFLAANRQVRIEALVEEGLTQEEAEELLPERGGAITPFAEAESLIPRVALSPITREKIKLLEGADAWSRVNDPLTPAARVEVEQARVRFWDSVNKTQEALLNHPVTGQRRDDERFSMLATNPYYLAPRKWISNLREREKAVYDAVTVPTDENGIFSFTVKPNGDVSGVPLTVDEMNWYRWETGIPIPMIHPDELFLRDYYSIEPEMFLDPYDNALVLWGDFYAAKEALLDTITDPARHARMETHITRRDTALTREFKRGNQTFMQDFWAADTRGPKLYREELNDPEGAQRWERLLKEVAVEGALTDVARQRGTDTRSRSSAAQELQVLRAEYRRMVTSPEAWLPGSSSQARAVRIRDFLQKFQPGRLN